MRMIGLGGYAGAGKDEVAKILVRDHGFQRVGFADPMRRILYATNPIITWCAEENGFGVRPVRLQEIVNSLGWDMAKREYPEIRELLQRFGNDAVKPEFGDDFWALVGTRKAAGNTVFSDARFDVECLEILRLGGQIWDIQRAGVGPVNGHESDSGQWKKHATRVILNDGTLADLSDAVFGAVQSV